MSASPLQLSDRDQRVDDLLAEGLAGRSNPGRWLVVGSLPSVGRALIASGAEIERWSRTAGGEIPARPDPPPGPYQGAVIRIPRGSEAIRMTLHLAAARLVPGGRLVVGGCNDEGIRSIASRLGEVVAEVEDPVPGRHARRIEGRSPLPALRGSLDGWAEEVRVRISDQDLAWTSWPGLFAHGRLDSGTALLLEELPDPRGASILDFGCGVGVIGEVLRRRGAQSLDLCDKDALAVHASRRNVDRARVHCADGLPDPQTSAPRWDLVVSNPPIHLGPDDDRSVLEALARALPSRLRPGGRVFLVTQVTVPVPRLFGPTFRSVEKKRAEGGFAVWALSG